MKLLVLSKLPKRIRKYLSKSLTPDKIYRDIEKYYDYHQQMEILRRLPEEVRKRYLESGLTKGRWLEQDLILSLSEEGRKQYLELESEKFKFKIVSLLPEMEREGYIQEFEDEEYKYQLVKNLPEEKREKYIQEFENEWYKSQIVLSLSSDEKKEKYIQEFKDESCKFKIVLSLSTDEIKEKYIQEFENEGYKSRIVLSLSTDEIKEKYIQEFKDENYKSQIVLSLSEEKREKYIQEFKSEEYKCRIIATFPEEKRDECIKYLQKAELIKKLYAKNSQLLEHLNPNILDSKYLAVFGEARINEISCFLDIQNMILKLNDDELKIFSICLNKYSQYSNNNGTWRVMAEKILTNINEFNITTLEEFENLEEVIKARCEEKIQSGDLEKMQEAVIRKIYGHSKGVARRYNC